jgi:carbonic anhydrase
MPTVRTAACALTSVLLSSVSSAQYVAPAPAPYYYGCGGVYLALARQNDDLARIRSRLRRLELETDESARAKQWISALEAENQNLRQQNTLFQLRVVELEASLKNAKDDPDPKREQ